MQNRKGFTMNNFKSIKSTGSKIKEVTLTVILAASLLGVTLSSNANAATESNISTEVSEFVAVQGEKVLAELNTQLQQSIDNQIQTFTVNYSLNSAATWWADEHSSEQVELSADVAVSKPNSEMN